MVARLANQLGSSGSSPTPTLSKSPKVEPISLAQANALLRHHYLGPVRTATICFGHDEGCTVWGVLRSIGLDRALKRAGFCAVELIRMVGVPKHAWAMSSLLSHSVRQLWRETTFDVAVTYADREMGHEGSTYRAANWTQIQDAQPDGFLWKLDGRRVNRKRFYKEFGTTSWPIVYAHYGERVTRSLDIPKARFLCVRDQCRLFDAVAATAKKVSWGARRLANFYRDGVVTR